MRLPWSAEARAERRTKRLALTDKERAALAAGKVPHCIICGGYHFSECPYVAEVEFDETGRRRRIVLRASFARRIEEIIYDSDFTPEPGTDQQGLPGGAG